MGCAVRQVHPSRTLKQAVGEKVKIAFTICKLLRSKANTNASGGLQLGRIIANPALHGNLEIRRLFCSE
jgi:hypothetical protein